MSYCTAALGNPILNKQIASAFQCTGPNSSFPVTMQYSPKTLFRQKLCPAQPINGNPNYNACFFVPDAPGSKIGTIYLGSYNPNISNNLISPSQSQLNLGITTYWVPGLSQQDLLPLMASISACNMRISMEIPREMPLSDYFPERTPCFIQNKATGQVIDLTTNFNGTSCPIMKPKKNNATQIFRLTPDGEIESTSFELVLEIVINHGSVGLRGTRGPTLESRLLAEQVVVLNQKRKATNQKWRYDPATSTIRSSALHDPPLVLGTKSTYKGERLIVCPYDSSKETQKFKLLPAEHQSIQHKVEVL